MMDVYSSKFSYRITTDGQTADLKLPLQDDAVYILTTVLHRTVTGQKACRVKQFLITDIKTVAAETMATVICDTLYTAAGSDPDVNFVGTVNINNLKYLNFTTSGVTDGYLTIAFERVMNIS